jgi:TRAP-type C4-dicarboxylate transport system permease small subunit
MELLGGIVVAVVAVLFIWQCWSGLIMHYRTGTHTLVFRYAVWPFFAAALVGSVVLFLEILTAILRSLREVIHPTGVEEKIYGAEAEVGL